MRFFAPGSDGLRGVDHETVLKLIVGEYVGFAARHPQLLRIMIHECAVDGERVDWLVEHHVRPIFELTIGYIERLVETAYSRDFRHSTSITSSSERGRLCSPWRRSVSALLASTRSMPTLLRLISTLSSPYSFGPNRPHNGEWSTRRRANRLPARTPGSTRSAKEGNFRGTSRATTRR